jgi:hypothetical protein
MPVYSNQTELVRESIDQLAAYTAYSNVTVTRQDSRGGSLYKPAFVAIPHSLLPLYFFFITTISMGHSSSEPPPKLINSQKSIVNISHYDHTKL